MKNLYKISSIIVALFVSVVSFSQTPGYHDVQVAEFEKLVNGGKGIVLDVRTPKEYAEGHLKGSVNINYFDKDFKGQVAKLDKSKPVYVYCHSGGRSSKAMTIMQGEGFKTVYNLTGGYSAWKTVHK